MRRLSGFNILSLALGLAFLYLPIGILVIYSFNASRLVTVWGGWSLAWYRELMRDEVMQQFPIPGERPAAPNRHQARGVERINHQDRDRQIEERQAERDRHDVEG